LYEEALSMAEAQDYEGALDVFELLGDYKDSLQKVETCSKQIYEKAVSSKKEGDYKNAHAMFKALNGYRDSADLAEICDIYIKVAALEKEEHYDQAYELLEQIGDTEAIAKSKTERAETLLESDDYDQACELLEEAGNTEMLNEINYKRGLELFESGEYLEAYDMLFKIDQQESSAKCDEIAQLLISAAEPGSTVMLGSYEQDNDEDNGKEPIMWDVLDRQGDRILLISHYVLEGMLYNGTRKEITWEDSSVRKWLNGAFIGAAFTEDEAKRILLTDVTADWNPIFHTVAGADTKDKVFCLSALEVMDYYKYKSHGTRRGKPTPYAQAHGGVIDMSGYAVWFLRTPGREKIAVCTVNNYGDIDGLTKDNAGQYVDGAGGGVRPAMWITSGEEKAEQAHEEDATEGNNENTAQNTDPNAAQNTDAVLNEIEGQQSEQSETAGTEGSGEKAEITSEGETENRVYTDAETVLRVQTALNEKGFDCGIPDGSAGPKTAAAVSAYQEAEGLSVTGIIDDELLEHLLK